MVYKHNKLHSCDKGLPIALTGKQLADSLHFDKLIKNIRSLVALPNEYYSPFYQAPIENFLAIYQVVGVEQMQLQLKYIVKALKIRRSYHLPLGAKPEDIHEKKDLWTYVIFSAALLYKLPDITSYKVLYKNPDDTHGYVPWNPYLGAIKAGHHYLANKISNNHTSLISMTLLPVILTQQCITWLYNEPEAFDCLLKLSTSPDQDTELGRLIIRSHNQSSQKTHIGHELYSFISNAIKGNIDNSDKLHNYLCLTHDGYAIAVPDIFNYFSTLKKEDTKIIEECFYSLERHKPSIYPVTFPNIGKKEAILLGSNDCA